ncbi:hypothetical protein BJ165DRAFT_1501255 [Panaeolus papilionaceus]|nr:hypothetical protein BJ165DRAFT_1501255 [Panaeolus papilionaceus]
MALHRTFPVVLLRQCAGRRDVYQFGPESQHDHRPTVPQGFRASLSVCGDMWLNKI